MFMEEKSSRYPIGQNESNGCSYVGFSIRKILYLYYHKRQGFNSVFLLPFSKKERIKGTHMAFFTTAITTLKTLVCAIGAGLAAWGVINLLEGYGNDNPGAKSQGIKQFMAN